MSTRSFTFTEDEARLIGIWANNARHDRDQELMLTRPESPQEKAALADIQFIEKIMAKLGGRDSVTPKGYN